jgi:hypothetical protein
MCSISVLHPILERCSTGNDKIGENTQKMIASSKERAVLSGCSTPADGVRRD